MKASQLLASPTVRRILRNRSTMVGGMLVAVTIVVALAGPFLAPRDPLQLEFMAIHQPPFSEYPDGSTALFGTDSLGRDVLSRVFHGGRLTLLSAFLCLSLALTTGSLLGAIAGYVGGWVDQLIMRVVDLVLSFPSILLAILFVSILGPSLQNAILAIAIVTAPQYTRLMRSSVLDEKHLDYVTAAHALGMSDTRVLLRSILPNCLGPLTVQGTMGLAVCILDTSGLSFLGLGAQPPSPEWGAMLLDGLASYRVAPWVVLAPGLAIFFTVLGINLLGDGLRQVLDPKLRR